MGRKIGEYIVQNYLKPIRQLAEEGQAVSSKTKRKVLWGTPELTGKDIALRQDRLPIALEAVTPNLPEALILDGPFGIDHSMEASRPADIPCGMMAQTLTL